MFNQIALRNIVEKFCNPNFDNLKPNSLPAKPPPQHCRAKNSKQKWVLGYNAVSKSNTS